MIHEIGALIIYSVGLLTGEYIASSMALLTLLIFIVLKGGKKKNGNNKTRPDKKV